MTFRVSSRKSTILNHWELMLYGFVQVRSPMLMMIPPLARNLIYSTAFCPPVYESPQVDMGYDISNYRAIHAPYGTVEDVDRLIAALHQKGMKLIMDLVVNHTSDQHDWFTESRSLLDNPRRDWYIWKKPKWDAEGNRCPPDNGAASSRSENGPLQTSRPSPINIKHACTKRAAGTHCS